MLRKLGLALLAVLALCAQARAQTLTTMFRFNFADGAAFIWTPVSDGQGNLYGTTYAGGAFQPKITNGGGTLYKFTPGVSRSFETLHSFGDVGDGYQPQAGLTYDQSTNMLYGTTGYGGPNAHSCREIGCGTIFSLNPATGAYTTLYAFPGGVGGQEPRGALALGSDGVLYGIALETDEPYGDDLSAPFLVFRFDPSSGSVAVLRRFSSRPEGAQPIGGLVFGKAGELFGLTADGGSNGLGNVYRLDPVSGELQTIYDFPFNNQTDPAGLTVDDDKNLYVTTTYGGTGSSGEIIKLTPDAGVTYTVSTLFNFESFNGENVTGAYPNAALTFDSVKNVLYGTTPYLGAGGYGTLFQINPDGSGFTVLHSFAGGTDAGYPDDAVVINLGELYGATIGKHAHASLHPIPQCQSNNGCGTLFRYPRF